MSPEFKTETEFHAALNFLKDFADNYTQPTDEGQELMGEIAHYLANFPDAPALGHHRKVICSELIWNHLCEDHQIGAVWIAFMQDCVHRIDEYNTKG
uniref:Uncharacterized protein n=1 Tax=mine drainage metagenome TaxID=410659 RepID=E6PPZ8_9ZZZZ